MSGILKSNHSPRGEIYLQHRSPAKPVSKFTVKFVVWLCALLIIGAYFYRLGAFPLVGPDEPRYAQVAREMSVRDDFVTTTLAGQTWFEKPALLYWMMIAGYRVFGVNEWSARFGSACSGLIIIFALALLARHAARSRSGANTSRENSATDLSDTGASDAGRSCGIITLAVAASTAGIVAFARGASFDIVLTMPLTLAFCSYFAAETIGTDAAWTTRTTGRGFSFRNFFGHRNAWLVGFYVSVGLALLAKGLVGVVLPCAVLALYFILRGKLPPRFLLRSLWWGAPLALLVAATWYAPVISRHGWTFIDEFFIQHHFARYVSNKYRHPQPFYFYIPIMLLLALPWTPVLVVSLWRTLRDCMNKWLSRWRDRSAPHANRTREDFTDNDHASDESAHVYTTDATIRRLQLFAFAWLLAPVLFFSASGSKLPGYVLPAVPGASLLVALEIERMLRAKSSHKSLLLRWCGALLLLIAAGAIVYAWRTGSLSVACATMTVAPGIVAGAFTVLRPCKVKECVFAISAATLLAVMIALSCAVAPLAERESVRGLLRRADDAGYGALPVFNLHTTERTAEFYAAERLLYDRNGEPVKFEDVRGVTEAARAAGGAALVFVPLEHAGQLTNNRALQAEVVGDNGGGVALVRVRARE